MPHQNARSLLHQWPHQQGETGNRILGRDHVSEPLLCLKNLFIRSAVDRSTRWFAGHLCWSKEKAINPRGVWGAPQGCALRRTGGGNPRAQGPLGTLVERTRFRFPPIDPVGNGNGKRSFIAGWLRHERPPVPVRQIVSHLNLEPIFARVLGEGAI